MSNNVPAHHNYAKARFYSRVDIYSIILKIRFILSEMIRKYLNFYRFSVNVKLLSSITN